MDIIKERLRREYGLDTIFTIPTVVYLVKSKSLSIPLIKTGNNIKNLIATGLYESVLKEEGYQLRPEQKKEIEQFRGIVGNMLEKEEYQMILELLKPRIVVKS